jgi:dihydrofolate reductase
MRKIVVHLQTTVDNRIANAAGGFWEPFPWGEPESAYLNEHFRAADTWAMSRVMYDAIVPWWETVSRGELPADVSELGPADREFAQILAGVNKVVFSHTMESAGDRIVIAGDLAAQLAALKAQDGRNIILACGPATLGPLISTPGLVDELLLAVHPVVLNNGPRMFAHTTAELGLRLIEAKVFDGGVVVLRHEVIH